MPDTYYLNNDSKNWKIHLNNLIAPNNENLKIISKQQDLILQDNFKITNDIINLQKKVAIEGHLDTTNANVKIPITFNNFSFCDPSNMQSVLTKTDNEWIDLSGFGYKIEVTPQSERSSIYLRMKINFFSSHQAGQLISFALYRDISGGANSEELFVDMNFDMLFDRLLIEFGRPFWVSSWSLVFGQNLFFFQIVFVDRFFIYFR